MPRPKLDHALTIAEETERYFDHLRMSQEDQNWLSNENRRMYDLTGYDVRSRDSATSSLRLFLIAEKGFTLEQALDLSDIPPEQLKGYFQEYYAKIANPSDSAEVNLTRMGEIHAKALRKIADYRLPDLSGMNSIEAMYEFAGFMQALGHLATDYYQTIDSVTTHTNNDAYYKGAGGREAIEKDFYRLSNLTKAFSDPWRRITNTAEGYFASDAKAYMFREIKNGFKQISGKKISEVNRDFHYNLSTAFNEILLTDKVFDEYANPEEVPTAGMRTYNDFLAGRTNNLREFKELQRNIRQGNKRIRQDEVSELRTATKTNLGMNPLAKYRDRIDPEVEETEDLFRLSEEKQKKLYNAYFGIFRGFTFSGMAAVYEMGLNDFDLIRSRNGKTIREIVNDRYPDATAEQKNRAMTMEATRQILMGNVEIRELRVNDNAQIELGNWIEIGYTKDEFRKIDADAIKEGLDSTRQERLALFGQPVNGVLPSLQELTPEQTASVNTIYDRVFGSRLNSGINREFKNADPQHPREDIDFFRVGGMSLRNYLGEARVNELSQNGGAALKAEILRLATEPSIPLTFMPASYNFQKHTYEQAEDRIQLVIDTADRERVIAQKPYLETLESFKDYSGKDGNGPAPDVLRNVQDDGVWLNLYNGQFHKAINEGLIPEDRVMHKSDLVLNSSDPDVPQQAVFDSVKTIYGPRPRFIVEWAGNSHEADVVYTQEQFKQKLPDHRQGGFSDDEFTLLSYFASMSPHLVGEMPGDEKKHLSKKDIVFAAHGHWTTDIGFVGFKPRERMGRYFFDPFVVPARKAAEKMISDYEAGIPAEENKSIADTLANGIDTSLKTILQASKFQDPYAHNVMNIGMLQKLDKMLQNRPDLAEQVYQKIGPENRRLMQGYIAYKDMMDEGLRADAKLIREEKGEIRLTPEEKTVLQQKVATYESYASRFERFRIAEEKRIEDDVMKKSADIYNTYPPKVAPALINPMIMNFKATAMKHPEDIMKDLLSPDREKEYERIYRSLDHLQAFYEERKAIREESLEMTKKDTVRNTYTDALTPEESFKAKKDDRIATAQLQKMIPILEARLSDNQLLEKVITGYNEIAKGRGWKEIAEKEVKTGVILEPERLDTYFNLLMGQFRRHPGMFYGIEGQLETCKHPIELDAEKLKVYPKKDAIDALIRKNPKISPEEQAYLMQAGIFLSEISDDSIQKISEVENRDHAVYLNDERILRQCENYNGEKGTFDGQMEMRSTCGDLFEVEVIPKNGENILLNVLQHPASMTGATREKAERIINMMDQAGMIDDGGVLESQDKIYSHARLVNSNIALRKAVDSKDIAAICDATKRYKEAYKEERKVFETIKKEFGNDPGELNIPGNVSSLRERRVPAEFTKDTVTDSRMNGLYMVGTTAKKLGVPVSEFLANPGKQILKYISNKAKTQGVNAIVGREDNFLGAFKKLYEAGQQEFVQDKFRKDVLQGLGGSLFVSRALDGIYRLEKDPVKQKELMEYQRRISHYADAAMDREKCSIMSIYNVYNPNEDVDEAVRKEVHDRMKQSFLESNGIKMRNLPVPYTGENGVEKDRPRSYEDVLAIPNGYRKLIRMFNKNVSTAREMDMDAPKVVVVEALFDYLKAHPEDMLSKDYKDLEKIALSAADKLEITPPQTDEERERTPAAEYRRWKESILQDERSLEEGLRRRDTELNQQLERDKRALAGSTHRGSLTVRSMEIINRMTDAIMQRQDELIAAWDRQEVTKSYFIKRYKNLQKFLIDPIGEKLQAPPKLVERTDPEKFALDIKKIKNRVSFALGKNELSSMDAFKEWKRNAVGEAERAALENSSEADWKRMYHDRLQEVNQNKPLKDSLREYRRIAGDVARNRREATERMLNEAAERGRNAAAGRGRNAAGRAQNAAGGGRNAAGGGRGNEHLPGM